MVDDLSGFLEKDADWWKRLRGLEEALYNKYIMKSLKENGENQRKKEDAHVCEIAQRWTVWDAGVYCGSGSGHLQRTAWF
ncbi:hypothetical protein I4300191C4_04840 [Solibaculum mannosilyticum]